MDHYHINKFIEDIIKLAQNPNECHNISLNLPFDFYNIINNEVTYRLNSMLDDIKFMIKEELKEQLKQAANPDYDKV